MVISIYVSLSDVLFLAVPCRGAESDRQDAGADQGDEAAVPAEMLEDVAHADVGQERRTDQVAEQTGETGGGAGGLLRHQVERRDADEHDGAVDQEADRPHGDVGHQFGAALPVDVDGHHDQRHVDDRGRGAASLEDLVREPAAEDRAEDAGDLEDEVRPTAAVERHLSPKDSLCKTIFLLDDKVNAVGFERALTAVSRRKIEA